MLFNDYSGGLLGGVSRTQAFVSVRVASDSFSVFLEGRTLKDHQGPLKDPYGSLESQS